MAGEKNVKIVSSVGSFDAKIETLSGKAEPRKVNGKEIVMKTDGSPKIINKNLKGEFLVFARYDKATNKPVVDANGQKLDMGNCYVDPQGQIAQDIVPYYETIDGEFIPATKNDKTEVFEIVKWEPITNFTDKYIVDNYYQVKPSQGKSKKDFQRLACVNANTREMKKVWDYMAKNKVVGRGILNITSAGYLPTIAYLRPVSLDNNKWTLEIGMFKQSKVFTWVEELDFQPKTVDNVDIEQHTDKVMIDDI
jgi:hypothetical protein